MQYLKFSKRVVQLNLATQFPDDEETWPPFKLKTFIPLLLMHYKDQHNLKQANAMAKLTYTGKIDDRTRPLLVCSTGLQGCTFSPRKSCPLESGHRRPAVWIAIEYSYV